jgi:DNA-binding transcriptional ArsR family regulator
MRIREALVENERPKLLRRVVETLAGDPERLMLANALAEAPASAAELAESAGLSPSRVRRHLRTMKEEGLIESTRTQAHRGTVEHFYVVSGELQIDEEELAALGFAQRRAMYSYILKLSLGEAIRALVSAPSGRSLERVDSVVVRTPMFVDAEGWAELAEIHADAYWRVHEAKERIAARLEEGAEADCRASSVIMLFEGEPPGKRSTARPAESLVGSQKRDQRHVDHQRRETA